MLDLFVVFFLFHLEGTFGEELVLSALTGMLVPAIRRLFVCDPALALRSPYPPHSFI
eukprot:m.462852 g.462852  ORF g.462852 m.462852 type:complete len:57 (-) comp57025_c1_seq10:247-417(-)